MQELIIIIIIIIIMKARRWTGQQGQQDAVSMLTLHLQKGSGGISMEFLQGTDTNQGARPAKN